METGHCVELRNKRNKNKNQPLVSVAMIAYNVQAYIAESIESVLDQCVDFNVELVIGEDCSTDATREIALSYQQRYPHIVRVLLHKKNLGLTPNSIATQNACRGKYIAMLDSDDYWTDKKKLYKQIEFLENNTEYSGCAHQATIIKGNASHPVRNFWKTTDTDINLNDTLTHRKFHTSSLVYKRSVWVDAGGIPENISSNERAMYPMIALSGQIRYLKDNMCVYRLAPEGLNSRISAEELSTDINMLPWLKGLNSEFPVNRFRSFLHLCVYTYPEKPGRKMALKHFIQFAYFSFSYFPGNIGDIKYGIKMLFKKI